MLSGTPPVTQPLPVRPDTLSYLDVYVYIGNDRASELHTVLGVFIWPGNTSTAVNADPSTTLEPLSTASTLSEHRVSRPHGVVLGMLIAACVLLLFLVIGGLGWIIVVRRHLKNQTSSTHQSNPVDHSADLTDARSQSTTPRWRQHESRSLQLTPNHGSFGTTSTRRRVRTAGQGTPEVSIQQSSPERVKNDSSTPTSSRKRAATLLQTIHSRAIRGSPRIGSNNSKGTLAPSLEITTRRTLSPRLGFGQLSPRIGLVEERPFTNSWCSALHMDPFQSPGRSTGLVGPARTPGDGENMAAGHDRPTSPTPNKGIWAGADQTMSVSELLSSPVAPDSSGGSSDHYDHEGNVGFMKSFSLGPVEPNMDDTPVSRQTRVHAMGSDSDLSVGTTKVGMLNRAGSYADRTNQLGIALLAPPANMYTSKPSHGSMGLSFDSFFSPMAIARESPVIQNAEVTEARYGDVSSERIVKIGRSQETIMTTYVTASEGISPSNETSKAGYDIPENIGIIGSPSTLHSQMAELDEISSPPLTLAGLEESPNESLSVEYGRADQSLRTLDSFPTIFRGSLTCFPQDVELYTPVLPPTNPNELRHREPSDIMLLPADDLSQGCTRLTRVGSLASMGEAVGRACSINGLGTSIILAQEVVCSDVHGEEDSILSHNLSEQVSEKEDSILSHEKHTISSTDSILVSKDI
jgi:hypothetical protein